MWLLSSENVLVDDERFPRELQVVIQQQAADYSECAHSCLHQVDCVLTDPESLCNDMTIADLTTCVVSGCGVDEGKWAIYGGIRGQNSKERKRAMQKILTYR